MTLSALPNDTHSLFLYEAHKKSRGVALLLWLCLGAFGAHRFYVRDYGNAAIMLALTLVSVFAFGTSLDGIITLVLVLWLLVDLFLVSGMVRRFNMGLIGGLGLGFPADRMLQSAALNDLYLPERSWTGQALGTAAMILVGVVILGGALLLGAIAILSGANSLGESLQKQFNKAAFTESSSANSASFEPGERSIKPLAYQANLPRSEQVFDVGMLMRVQAGLKAFGIDDVVANGVMNTRTRAAIGEFQSMFDLPETGEPDEAVYGKMREVGLIQ